ncbi:MAG: hypothetical protein ACAI34_16755 [Verrucomicrobium sp.]
MIEFLQSLLDQGLAVVSLSPAEEPEAAELAEIIQEYDRRQRSHMAGEAPELDLPAATWAAGMLYESIRLLAARDVDAAGVSAALNQDCPVPHSPSVDYSVDLFLQYLPEIHQIASRLASEDPLVRQLVQLGSGWPLSSVGIPLPQPATLNLKPLFRSPALVSLYADRILQTGDTSRLTVPEVTEAVTEALGAFPELSPKVAQHLRLPVMDVPL